MPLATPSNNYKVGLHKQTNEATPGTVAEFSVPVYSSDLGPDMEPRRIEVTDAAAIEGDIYYGPASWRGSFEMPANGLAIGTVLQGLWPTDGVTGVGPYTHTFSGLGGSQSWQARFVDWLGTFKQTFAKGLTTGLKFSADQDGGPMRIAETLIGQEVTIEAHTVTAPQTLASGYFTLQATGCKVELDVDTPNVNPSAQPEKVRNFVLEVSRSATAEPVADNPIVSVIGQGKVANALSMQWLYTSFDAYRASYFGAVAGTTLSPVVVKGALELTAKHSVEATWELRLYIPAVAFRVTPPSPNPDGSSLVLDVVGLIQKPATGDHIQPVLINSQTGAY